MKEQLYNTTLAVLNAIEFEANKEFTTDIKSIDALTKCLETLNRIGMMNGIELKDKPCLSEVITNDLKIDAANAERLEAVLKHMFECGEGNK